MRRNLTIVFTILLCVIISISCVAFGNSVVPPVVKTLFQKF